MSDIRLLLILIPALPLAAAVVTALLGPKVLRQHSHWPVVIAIVCSFLCSVLLAARVYQQFSTGGAAGPVSLQTYWTWVDVTDAYTQQPAPPARSGGAGRAGGERDFLIDVTLRDSLTAIMLVMVTFVSSLVAIYSIGYMHGDRGYPRFFAYIGLFVFSMTMLVSVSNFLLLYVFWEAVGVCSYLLIGFWYQKDEAAAAGKKAFLVNRIGDFGFALAIFLIWTSYGTLNFHDTMHGSQPLAGVLGQARLSGQEGFQAGAMGLAICLLLMLGACGKSAQFPLHVWLPDAMEGPTPVSALIHAATMVTAGVYMVTRCTPLFAVSPESQVVVAVIGGFTALLAGVIALTQYDLKRVLAYSTISQLGYMFLGLGTGTLAGITAGMFHLFTHAFFKALLFLGAGSVMHAMGGQMDMRRFGGLRRLMPITHWTFAVGCLALAGVFPFAGFWSKDAIVAAVHARAQEDAHLQHQPHQAADPHVLQVRRDASGEASSLALPSRVEKRRAARLGRAKLREHTTLERTRRIALSGGSGTDKISDWETAEFLVSPATYGRHTRHEIASAATATATGTPIAKYAGIYRLLYYVALFTAFLTAIYTFRAFFLTFYGRETIPYEAGEHAHESPPSMWVPLSILAAFAAAIGYACEQSHVFAYFLQDTPSLAYVAASAHAPEGAGHFFVAVISTCIAVGGVGLAAFLYLGHQKEVEVLTYLFDFGWLRRLADLQWAARLAKIPPLAGIQRAADAVGAGAVTRLIGYLLLLVTCVLISPLLIGYYFSPYKLSYGKFYFDELYGAVVVWPLRALASVSYAVDRWVIDGLVNLCGRIPVWIGGLMRSLQMGLIPFYGLAMVLGVLTVIAAKIFWGGG